MGSSNVFQIILQTIAKGHGAKDAGKELTRLQKSAKKAAATLKNLAIAAGVVGAAVISAKKAFEFAEAGAQIQRIEASFNTLAKSVGQDATGILDAMKAASNGTIDEMTAMTAANRALILGVAQTPEEFSTLTAAATALGQAMGESASQAVDDLTTGIGRMSPLILDNLGIVGASINAYPQYAAAIGTTADKLTDAQKKQALLNYALEKAEPLLDANGKVIGDNAAAFEKFGAQSEDAGNRFKKNFADLIAPFVSDMADSLESINQVGDAMELLGAKSVNYAGRQFYVLADGVKRSRQELLDLAATAKKAGENVGGEAHGIARSFSSAKGEIEGLTAAEYYDLAARAIIAGEYEAAQSYLDLAKGAEKAKDRIAALTDYIMTHNGLHATYYLDIISSMSQEAYTVSGGGRPRTLGGGTGQWQTDALGRQYKVNPDGSVTKGANYDQQQAWMKNFSPVGGSNTVTLDPNEKITVSRPGQPSYTTNNNGNTFNIATQIDAEAVVSQLSKAARRA